MDALDMASQQPVVVTGNTTITAPENRVFYPALDGLRTIAFLMVFFYHYKHIAYGWAGVNLFFVLSGFLITGILYDTAGSTHRLRNFYIRRALRIFPLYYGVMLLLVLSWPYFHWQWNFRWLVWPFYVGNYLSIWQSMPDGAPIRYVTDAVLLFSHGPLSSPLSFGHFWSLCVEEQFYLVWPWVVFWVGARLKLMRICAAAAFLCLAARLTAFHLLPTADFANIVTHMTPFRIDDLLIGGFVALALRGENAALWLRRARAVAPYILAAFMVWVAVSVRNSWSTGYVYPRLVIPVGFTLMALGSALIILLAIQPQSPVFHVLNFAPLRALGRISYGAYIFHEIFHIFYLNLPARIGNHLLTRGIPFGSHFLTHPTILTALFGLIGTYTLAWLSFRYFETPILNLKARYTR